MSEREVLVELRFDSDALDSYEGSAESLRALDVEKGGVARDPTILATLTVAAAVVLLVIELVKLAKELRAKGKKQGILLVTLDQDNNEKSLALLEASEADIRNFVTGE